jgi:hypothetical protein
MNRPYRPAPPVRPASQRLDGWTRLLIVGGGVALATWFAWPYVRNDIANLGSQLDGGRRARDGLPPVFDPFGVMPRAEARDVDPREDRRRRRYPDREERYSDREERYPGQRGESRQDRPSRYRECSGGGWWSQHPNCGPWQDGDLPPRGRR